MIESNYTCQTTPGMQVLSEAQKTRVHHSTLELLRRTGVRVVLPEVRDLLADSGCWVDGDRVRIPPHLVDWAIKAAPARVVLCNRSGEPALFLEGRKAHYGTGSDTPFVLDANTGERRPTVLEDIRNVSRLVDALGNIDFLMCMGIASDVPESISDIYHFREMVSNTVKPIVYTAWSEENLRDIIEMAEAVAGGAEPLRRNPFCALYSEPISPLVHAKESCEKLLYVAEKGLPVVYGPGMQIGGTAPVTVGGALVQANAEQLSGLLICQLVREGTPVIAAGGILFMDMAKGAISYAAPEFMVALVAFHEMTHYYGLPNFSYAGCSDAKVFDQQAGAEGSLWMLLTALSGGNLIHDVGYLESGLTSSYQMLVAMNEIAGLVKQFMQGVDLSNEALALDVINEVGPGGHYLDHDHTFRHFRDNWVPDLVDRANRAEWEISGQLTLGDRATDRVRELLKGEEPESLNETIADQLEAIIHKANGRARTG